MGMANYKYPDWANRNKKLSEENETLSKQLAEAQARGDIFKAEVVDWTRVGNAATATIKTIKAELKEAWERIAELEGK